MKPGNRVKFLNDTGGGVIVRFLDPETVLVRIEDGFEVPVKLKELIPDIAKKADVYKNDIKKVENISSDESPEGIKTGEIKSKKTEQNVIPEEKNSDLVYLAFTHEVNPRHLNMYLINDTDFHIYYIIGTRKLEQHLHQYSGLLEPNTKVILGNIKITKTDDPTIYSIQYIGYKIGYYQPFLPVDSIIEIDTKKLTDKQYETENDFFEKPAALFELETKHFPIDPEAHHKLLKQAEKEFIVEKIGGKPSVQKKETQKTTEVIEVDLHIHEIVEDTKGLSEGEMLEIQLRRFEMSLETALHGNVKKVVFIHGVGQGKLKHEISKILNKKYPDLKYQDASFREYGYGATMVLL
jgi:hypothetical protein